MTVGQALAWARQELSPVSNQAFWESLALIAQATGWKREQLLTYSEWPLSPEAEATFASYVKRCRGYEPVAYILGHCQFYGLDFLVDSRVLIPRPETELLVERALEIATQFVTPVIADIGTGCGAMAITLALKLPQAQIYAVDSSPQALEVAQINCQRLGVEGQVHRLLGELLAPLPRAVNIIVANLPYIPEEEIENLPPEVRLFEPIEALNGGEEGLEKVKGLLAQLPGKISSQGYVLLEVGWGQALPVQELLQKAWPQGEVQILPDLSGIARIVIGSPAQGGLLLPPPTSVKITRVIY